MSHSTTGASSSSSSTYAERRAKRSCGVCADDEQLFATMTKQIQQQALANNTNTNKPQTSTSSAANIPIAVALPTPPVQYPSSVSSSSSSTSTASSTRIPLPCPPDSSALGRATWTFLHTMSAYYPDQPTSTQQSQMKSLLMNFGQFYPCPTCAEHLQQHLQSHPPPTQSRSALSLFLCNYHNDVNARLGKKQFDCSRVDERWGNGPAIDAGYDCIETNDQTPSSY